MLAVMAGAALGLLEWRVVARNRGTPYNGIGAVLGTLEQENDAPMRYRVLVPWLAFAWARALDGLGLYPLFPVWLYQVVKTAMVTGSLAIVEALAGPVAMGLAAVLVASTFEYDYWSSYAELVGVGLILLGRPWSVGLGALVWGLSKETAVLAPVVAYAAGGNVSLGMLGPGLRILVRLVQGPATLYCERWTWRAYNVPDLRQAWARQDAGVALSVAWTVVTVAAVGWLVWRGEGVVARTAPVALAWVGAAWVVARARETRVMLPTVIWLAAALAGVRA
jgi:hypothetical protein